MKKNLILFVLGLFMLTGTTIAQKPFQGTITMSMKMMGEGADQMAAMMPTSMDLTVGKKDMVIKMNGGMMAAMMGTILVKTKKGVTYMIKDSEETAYKMPKGGMGGDGENTAPTVAKEDEVITILGYECQKYKITTNTSAGEMTQYVWATDKIQLPKGKKGESSSARGLTVKGVPGVALKTMGTQGPFTVINTAIEIKPGTPEKSMFKIPKGYDVEDFDPSSLGGFGM